MYVKYTYMIRKKKDRDFLTGRAFGSMSKKEDYAK